MTVKHSIIVGLEDIKTVIFECRQCHTRVSMLPDKIQIPKQCPIIVNRVSGSRASLQSSYEASAAKYVNFVQSIGHIRKGSNDAAFRIMLEFDEFQTDNETQS